MLLLLGPLLFMLLLLPELHSSHLNLGSRHGGTTVHVYDRMLLQFPRRGSGDDGGGGAAVATRRRVEEGRLAGVEGDVAGATMLLLMLPKEAGGELRKLITEKKEKCF